MAYIAPIHSPSSVRHAIKLNFLETQEETLVVAKANRLEIYSQTPDGLSLRYTKAVYGRVTMLARLRPEASTTDHLFIGTDMYMYFTISWDPDSKALRTEKSYLDQADKSSRDSQTGDRCAIDPSGRYLSLEVYEGVFTIIPIAQKTWKNTEWEIGNLTEPIPMRVPEMFVRSSTFFETKLNTKEKKAMVALLYEDTLKKVRLKIRPVSYHPGLRRDVGTMDLEVGEESLQQELELGANHLIPIPSPTCGLLIVGETSITYYEHSSGNYMPRPLKEATIFTSWTNIDRQRFVLGDEYGKLYLLMLELDRDEAVAGWRLDVIGETSRASVLVYLDDGNVFVGSTQGDSQVINIKHQAIDIVQTLPNIGPILDFTIMDMGSRSNEGHTNEYSSGQARLVTGSGSFKDGSLRSVRSGVGLDDLGSLGQVENATNMFSVRSTAASNHVDTLVVSFINESRVFRFGSDGDVEELESFAGLALDTGTLFASNSRDGRILQVTSSSACLSDGESGMVVSEWTPPNSGTITAVTANDDSLVILVGGTSLFTLELSADLAMRNSRTFAQENQVACIAVPHTEEAICIVGFWSGSTISILNLDTLQDVSSEDVSEDSVSVPRSILLLNLIEDHPPTLLIAMADGNVITYSMDPRTGTLSGRRSVVLGTEQANFRALARGDGLYNVFATCEHPSLIYGYEGRIVYSAITAEDASCVCPFDAEAYPNAIAIATKTDLKLALVDEQRSTHVQGLPVGETVRRIAYSPGLKAFGLCTIRRTLEDGAEVVQSHFKLADEVMFKVLDTYDLNDDELAESVMRCELNDGSGPTAERFVVGTAYLDADRADAVRGRIIIFEVTDDRRLKLVTEHAVKGACRCLAMIGDKIVAGLIKTVIVYDLTYTTPSEPYLKKCASYRTSTAPIDISIHLPTSTIAIADIMKSLSLVRYTPGSNGNPDALVEIARHFQTTWATACAYISPTEAFVPAVLADSSTSNSSKCAASSKEEDALYLESDAEGNLILLQRDANSDFAEDKRRLKTVAELHLGEMVNKIRAIKVSPLAAAESTAVVHPRAFLATVEGSIHLFGLIAPGKLDFLLRLQACLAERVKSPGNVPFNTFRAFRNAVRVAEEPFRFVDGELVDRFLELSEKLQGEVVGELGSVGEDAGGVEGARGLLEALRRLR